MAQSRYFTAKELHVQVYVYQTVAEDQDVNKDNSHTGSGQYSGNERENGRERGDATQERHAIGFVTLSVQLYLATAQLYRKLRGG